VRVGRHTSSIAQVMETWTESEPGRGLVARDVPRFREVVRLGVGHYLHDPSKAGPGRLYFE
jgi:hypothetical protein